MDAKNRMDLEKAVMYSGFSEIPSGAILDVLSKSTEKATYQHNPVMDNEQTKAVLHFKQKDDNWYYNSFELTATDKDGKQISRNFKLKKEEKYTLLEAFKMLKGKSVYKNIYKQEPDKDDPEKKVTIIQPIWATLDFKNTDKDGNYLINRNYNYDLDKVLDQYPIHNLDIPNVRAKLKQLMEKGNSAYAKFDLGDRLEERYIEANPLSKDSLKVYDKEMNMIHLSTKVSRELSQGESQDQSQKQQQKNNVSEDRSPEGPSDESSTKKGVNFKKRIRKQKGPRL